MFRYKGFSLINIFGLSLSMSVCMLIIVVIQDQYSYDKMHTKSERIYRIQQVDSLASIGLRMGSNPYVLGTELRDNYALAEKLVILNNSFEGEGIYKDTRLAFSGLYANSEFFDVFDFQLASGSATGILDDPYSLVLSWETARKFFGEEDPLGKFIRVDSLGSYEIRGVLAQTKQKSHIQFEALVSIPTLEIEDQKRENPRFVNNWETGWGSWIYLLLDKNAELKNIQQVLDQISREQYKDNEETNLSDLSVKPSLFRSWI